jgi:hypothetical protein
VALVWRQLNLVTWLGQIELKAAYSEMVSELATFV